MPTANLDAPVILVPVDFDEASRRAVSTAEGLARALGGRVVILHVVPPTSFPEGTRLLPVGEADPIDLGEYVSARARKLLDEHFSSVLVGGTEVRSEARSGHPVETILRAIGECEATLVVVGTHARAGVARMLYGSVAEDVVRHSPVPVMVVREMVHAHDDTLVGAAVMTGAVAGAATGALAGPFGAIAGGTVGAVVGAIAGSVMDPDTIDEQRHGTSARGG